MNTLKPTYSNPNESSHKLIEKAYSTKLKVMAIAFKNLFLLFALLLVTNTSYSQHFNWAMGIGGSGEENCTALKTDTNGNIYCTGSFQGTVDFDPSTGVTNLTSIGSDDIFVSKFDSSGHLIWVKQIGGINSDIGYALSLDSNNNIFLVGTFNDTVDFDPGAGITDLISQGGNDIFIARFDSNGNFVWAKQFGNAYSEPPPYLALDKNNRVVIGGLFKGTVDFDPGTNVYNLTAPTSANGALYISVLDSNGNFIMAKQITGGSAISISGIAVETDGTIFTLGRYFGTTDFDPGSGVHILTATPFAKNFLLKLDSNGNFVWVISHNGNDPSFLTNCTYSLAINSHHHIYVSESDGNNFGYGHFIITKFDTSGNVFWSSPLFMTNNSYSLTYVATDTADNVYTVGNFGSMLSPAPFNLVSSNGNTYIYKLASNGNLVWIRQYGSSYSNGNFSQVNNLTLDKLNNIYTCGLLGGTCDFNPDSTIAYMITSNGGHDFYIQKLSQPIPCVNSNHSITINECDSYTLNGQTYSSSGTYIQTIPKPDGCDSILTLHLSLVNLYASAIITNNVILALFTSGASFQWLDCNSGFTPIPGETNQSFTPSAYGSYAVVITYNGCIDTSICYTVTDVGLGEYDSMNQIKIFPTPASEELTLTSSSILKNASLKLINSIGQTVMNKEQLFGKQFTFNISNLAKGVYMAQIKAGGKMQSVKIIKE